MGVLVIEAFRQTPGDGIALAIGVFGGADAGGAGADEDADPVGAVAFAGRAHRRAEPVLLQPQSRQSVVAAIERRELPRQRLLFQTGDPPDPGGQGGVLEIAGAQPAFLAAQCRQRSGNASSQGIGHGTGGNRQRLDG